MKFESAVSLTRASCGCAGTTGRIIWAHCTKIQVDHRSRGLSGDSEIAGSLTLDQSFAPKGHCGLNMMGSSSQDIKLNLWLSIIFVGFSHSVLPSFTKQLFQKKTSIEALGDIQQIVSMHSMILRKRSSQQQPLKLVNSCRGDTPLTLRTSGLCRRSSTFSTQKRPVIS